MRLIDADKLHYKKVYTIESYKSAVVVFAKEIDKANTIDAIPIEWIKETIELAKKVGEERYADKLEVLLEDWEEDCAIHNPTRP